MRKSGTRFSARIPRQAFGKDHGHDIDVDPSKHRDRWMDVDRNRLVQSKVMKVI
jgi:hypothetical protein